MFGRMRKREWIWILLFSLALGMALSLNLEVHYEGIWSSISVNYLSVNWHVVFRGILFAVPAFLLTGMLNNFIQRKCRFFSGQAVRKISNPKFFLIIWGLLLLCWLPYLLTFYPGGIVGDGAEALEDALNQNAPIDGKRVVFYVLLLRFFLKLGSLFSADINFSVFLYTCVSCLLYSAVCAAVVAKLRKKGVPAFLLCLIFLTYALAGHYASYSMALWKDGLFGAGIVMLSLLLWQDEPPQGRRKKWKVEVGLICLFLCLWRNAVGYAMLAAGAGMALFSKKHWRGTGMILMAAACAAMLLQMLMSSLLEVTGTPVSESMGIPIQQVAAVICSGGELTEAQAEFLFSLLPEEEWKALYAPTLCDPVKRAMDNDLLSAEIFRFYGIWLQLLLKYPGIYIRAHLMETLGFWQPYGSYQGFYYDWFVGIQDLFDRGYQNRDLFFGMTGISIKPELLRRMRFLSSGTCVWLMLLSFTLLLCQQGTNGQRLRAIFPCVVCWLIVFFSAPIAYSFRYVEMAAMGMPLFLCLPFLREEAKTPENMNREDRASTARRGRIRRLAMSGRVAVLTGCAVILLSGITMILSADQVGRFENGQLVIWTSGEEDNSTYYVTKGLSNNEESFTWTEGDSLEVRFRGRNRTGSALDVILHVGGTFNGVQHVEVLNQAGEETASLTLNGEGDYRFTMDAADQDIQFTLRFPDAAVVSDILENAEDHRKVSLQLKSIELTEHSDLNGEE